jgi:molybdopterin molybdotransferase
MLDLEQAREKILSTVRRLPEEIVPLHQAHERVACEDVLASIDLPSFDNSAVDGYAVIAADLRSASRETPVKLRQRGLISAGQALGGELRSGDCVRVFTGAAFPAGADAVVMQEDSKPVPERPEEVLFFEPGGRWENVRLRGEDVKCGAVLTKAGQRLRTGGLALLAASGIDQIKVARQPVIGVVATGSELVEAGKPLAVGKIYESNRIGLAALLTRAGAVPRIFPLVPDTRAEIRSALEEAFRSCDAVVTTGGVSVGEFDFVKIAFQEMGGTLDFWRVAIKPGKPFVFGRWAGKFLFGLPGNPVSAAVTFLMLVRPALLRLQGATDLELPSHPGLLADSLTNRGDRRHFMRVEVDSTGNIRSAGAQSSHMLGSWANANGLVDVPPRTILERGNTVQVWRLDL